MPTASVTDPGYNGALRLRKTGMTRMHRQRDKRSAAESRNRNTGINRAASSIGHDANSETRANSAQPKSATSRHADDKRDASSERSTNAASGAMTKPRPISFPNASEFSAQDELQKSEHDSRRRAATTRTMHDVSAKNRIVQRGGRRHHIASLL